MKNRDFIDLLHGEKFTIGMLADGIFASRPHVNMVLRNHCPNDRPNFGKQTRRKLIKFFKDKFVTWPAMLAALGWNEAGDKCNTDNVPHGT